jgi:glycosyltransferase involved in cell wall biosynthesis
VQNRPIVEPARSVEKKLTGRVDRRIGRRAPMLSSSTPVLRRAPDFHIGRIGNKMHRIALVMIVRDEERSLGRCLASAMPWVDEAVVLDTGSRDATAAVARRCGARVASFSWVNDFAAARNAALALTDAPWRIVLDADEWITSGGDAIAALRCAAPDFLGQIRVTSLFDEAGGSVGSAPSWISRVLPRGVAYAGRIHEQPQSALPRRRLPLVVTHDGYLDAQKMAKAGRNEALLELALAERPDDGYLRYQLGKDLEVRGRFDAAGSHYERALATTSKTDSWRHDLVLRTLFTSKKLGRFEAAITFAEVEMANWADSPDFYFTLGDLLLDTALARPERAAELLPMIEASWLQALAIGERPHLHDTVHGRGSFLAAHNLAALHASFGNEARAAEWRERAAAMRKAATPGGSNWPVQRLHFGASPAPPPPTLSP